MLRVHHICPFSLTVDNAETVEVGQEKLLNLLGTLVKGTPVLFFYLFLEILHARVAITPPIKIPTRNMMMHIPTNSPLLN